VWLAQWRPTWQNRIAFAKMRDESCVDPALTFRRAISKGMLVASKKKTSAPPSHRLQANLGGRRSSLIASTHGVSHTYGCSRAFCHIGGLAQGRMMVLSRALAADWRLMRHSCQRGCSAPAQTARVAADIVGGASTIV